MLYNVKRNLGGALAGLAVAGILGLTCTPKPIQAAELSIDKVGSEEEFRPVTDFCGTQPIRVAYAVGAVNGFRNIKFAELKDEASKCSNITEVNYTSSEGNPERELANIRSLAAQGFNIIIIESDAGAGVIPAMRDAVKAGSVVIMSEAGTNFPGRAGVDYTMVVTPNQEQMANIWAEWLIKTLDNKGQIVVWGGAPGAAQTAAQKPGWEKAFTDDVGTKVLEGPVISNWDPAYYQKVTTALLAKYPEIDGMYSDYSFGVLGSLRAFVAAGRPLVPVTGLDSNGAQCFYLEHKKENPNFEIGFTGSWNWIQRLSLRKGLAAVNDIDTDEPSVVNVRFIVDSTSDDPDLQPSCDPELPDVVSLRSGLLSRDELLAVFKK